MKFDFKIGAVLATAIVTAVVSAQNNCFQEGGNYYCEATEAIEYTNFGTTGSYNRVTGMDIGTKQCSSTKQSYSGGMAPFDREVSWHFRGPMHIKQFAYYTLGTGGSKAKRDESGQYHKRHGHQRFHDKYERDSPEAAQQVQEKRAVGDIVVATINGQVVSWTNAYNGGAVAATPAPAPASPHAEPAAGDSGNRVDHSNSGSPSPATPMNAGAGNWGRQAYYNAATGDASGLAFLNNMGGAGSGTFDNSFGLSLSYASADGKTCAASSQILGNGGWLDDAVEIILMTDKKCTGDSCGFSRPKGVAHHGFDGASKMFLLEFDMPLTGGKGFNKDMPAAWILNAEIPRTAQYANPASCSCWESGCGEWDIFEVLDSGNLKCKSTWHGAKSHGDSNFFERPTGRSRKAAVIMDGTGEEGRGSILYLDDGVEFEEVIGVGVSNAWKERVNVVQARLPN